MNTADYLLEYGVDQDVALITNRNQFTYQDLRRASARMAHELIRAGIQPGDRVGILATNSLFWVASYLAVLKLKAIAVPFATILSAGDFSAQALFSDCRAICAERRILHRITSSLPLGFVPLYDDLIADAIQEEWPDISDSFGEHQDAAFMFTSGTTATPRAVRVTHRNIQANTNSIIEYLELSRSDRIMVVLPFYYCFGTSLLHTHLRAGGSLVLSNSFAYPETVLDLMDLTQCTGFAGVPSTYQILLRNSTFQKRRMTSLHKVQQAGGKLQDVLIRELIDAVPEGKVYVMYGQTEATARLSYLRPDLLKTKLGSIGKGIPGVTLVVTGESGEEVQPGEVGEIIARGENICPGYLNDPETTAQKFAGGALHTGDLATIDEEGFIYIVDRKSDFIKSYGYRVSSQQIESCILELPEVVSSAVIGEPDLVRGESIKAYVVLKNGSTLTSTDVITYCAQHLAHHMVPKEVIFIDHLPLNANGKVRKTELRKSILQPVH